MNIADENEGEKPRDEKTAAVGPERSPSTQRNGWTWGSLVKLSVVLVPLAAFTGHGYREGFIKGLGLAESEFSLEVHEYIYSGVMAAYSAAGHFFTRVGWAGFSIRWFYAVLFLAMVLTLGRYLWHKAGARLAGCIHLARVRLGRSKKTTSDGFNSMITAVLVLVIVAVLPQLIVSSLLVSAFGVQVGHWAGVKDARDTWEKAASSEAHRRFPSALVTDEQGRQLTVLIVECRETSCAVFDGHRFVAVRKELISMQWAGGSKASPFVPQAGAHGVNP